MTSGDPSAGTRAEPIFHVVLHQPEIPNNTGNIGRTCVAVGAALHLVHPLGFEVSDKACRRAGLDYWPRLHVAHHDTWSEYSAAHRAARRILFTARARTCLFDLELRPGDHLVFGKESVGLPPDILADPGASTVALPMLPGERSLNLATVVTVALYEGVRQLTRRGHLDIHPSSTGLLLRPHPSPHPSSSPR